jgi:two-component system, chemotaxis family, CheB/CheR fusion protein
MSEPVQNDEAFDRLLDYLHRSRGFDFSKYKRASLMRRVLRRMQMVSLGLFDDYIDYLEVHPDEFAQLFNTILINVTGFFRDADVWRYVASQVLPPLVASENGARTIRIWSAGCASGEEPYTIAMLLAEQMGMESFCQRVKIYATDADEEALNQARQASYSERQVADVPPELRSRYFDLNNHSYVFHREMRRCVIFGRHDLINDAPISKVDLLSCRNTLMYFNVEAQLRILTRFHFALVEDGVMLLGKAETMLTRGELFTPLDLRQRVFRKLSRGSLRDRLLALTRAEGYERLSPVLAPSGDHAALRAAVFEFGEVALIVLDADGSIVALNERARDLFVLSSTDEGRRLQDLEVSYRPVELRSLIEKAYVDRRPVTRKRVEAVGPDGKQLTLDLEVTPLFGVAGTTLGVMVAYRDVTPHHALQDELRRAHDELESAYEELQSTGEELETTNEELQSTVEELETTNEELQSSNEELETMNEELQSTNEEMQAVNEELRERTVELKRGNTFLRGVLSSLRAAVVVVDEQLRVHTWNRHAEDLWGLRAEEAQGKNLLNLDIGLAVDRLHEPIRQALQESEVDEREVLVLPATNRRGRPFQCRVSCSPMSAREGETCGVILLMEEAEAQ